ncbi:MAG TPA: DUF559 domain-containing protein [Caulobacteraceae bacterium]|nr:DUF559 domain-containing protein [Caulobacteraceae bacterium]
MAGHSTIRRTGDLRDGAPLCEVLLWNALRHGRLRCLTFWREHPVAGHYADFACPELRLVIEVQGARPRHADEIVRDDWRAEALEAAGWQVIRFTSAQVMEDLGAVLAAIEAEARIIRGVTIPPAETVALLAAHAPA